MSEPAAIRRSQRPPHAPLASVVQEQRHRDSSWARIQPTRRPRLHTRAGDLRGGRHLKTFSKAFGELSASVAGRVAWIRHLQNGCRSLIDSTALPPSLDGAVATLELVRGRAIAGAFFARTRNRFPTRLRELRFATDGSTQILPLPLVVGESEAAVDLSAALGRARGVRNVDPPAIPARGNYAPALLAMATYHEGDLEHVQSALESVRAKGVKR